MSGAGLATQLQNSSALVTAVVTHSPISKFPDNKSTRPSEMKVSPYTFRLSKSILLIDHRIAGNHRIAGDHRVAAAGIIE